MLTKSEEQDTSTQLSDKSSLIEWDSGRPDVGVTRERERVINFVVIADAHVYTGDMGYLPSIVQRINALEIQPDFVMALGDNICGHKDHQVLQDAIRFDRYYSRVKAPRYYVMGNHECISVECYRLLAWDQLLDAWGMKKRWYSFDVGDFHICVLDGWMALNPAWCQHHGWYYWDRDVKKHGWSLSSEEQVAVFKEEQEWFLHDLTLTSRRTIVFVHSAIGFQQADCQEWIDTDNRKFWPPGNFFERTFEANKDKIAGVFEGHKHKCLWKKTQGIWYHQMGAAHMHHGQFAQVFVDPISGDFYVQAHPDQDCQNSECDIQQTYGRRDVLFARTQQDK